MMKYLLPLLCCAAVFFAGRQFRIARASSAEAASPAPAGEAATKQRGDAKGLARQAARLAGQNPWSASALDRLYRGGKLSDDEFRLALAQAAEKDPAGTWEWLDGQGFEKSSLGEWRDVVFGVWFKQDPAVALSRIETLPRYESGQLVAKVLGRVASGDPAEVAAVRDHLDRLVDLLGTQLNQVYFPSLNAESAALLLALPEGLSRDRLLGGFVVSWMMKDPVAAAAFLRGQPAALRNRSMEDLATQVLNRSQNSPEVRQLAMDWLLQEAPVGTRFRFGPRLADAMAEKDPAGALKWAMANLDGRPLEEATGGIVGRMFAANPADARALVDSLPAGKRREYAAGKVAQQWVATEPDAAITWWLEHNKDGVARDVVAMSTASTLASIWLNKHPDSFRAWLADPDSPQLPQQFLYSSMGTLLKDRAAGLDWIGSLPPATRTAVVKVAYDHLAMEAPADAAATFDSRPDLANGDAARTIATRWYASNPQKAIGWVANLPWGGTREAALAGLRKVAESQAQSGGSIPEELRELLR